MLKPESLPDRYDNRSEYATIQKDLKEKLWELQEKYVDRGLEYSELQEVIKNYW